MNDNNYCGECSMLDPTTTTTTPMDVRVPGTKENKDNSQFSTMIGDQQVHIMMPPHEKRGMTRYHHGLQHSFPVRFVRTPKDRLPLDSLGFFNYLTFSWLTPYLWQVYRKGAEAVSHLGITHTESAEVNAIRMERFWAEELNSKGAEKASFASAIFKSFETRFLIGTLVNLVGTVLIMANPIYVINYFLEYLSEDDVTIRQGIIYVIILAVFIILRGLCGCFCWMLNVEAATRIKSGTHAMVYSKILRTKSLRDKSVGDLINLFSLDGQCLWDGVIHCPLVVGGAIGLIISCAYSVHFLGPWALLAWLVIIGVYPFMGSLAKKSMMYRRQSIYYTDQRVGLLSEILNSVNFIKMNAWETPLGDKITELRSQERSVLEKSVFTISISMGTAMLVPLFASCLTFIGYVASGNNLTATQAFTFVALLNTMQIILATIPFALKSLSDMFVSARRIKEVLLMDEMTQPNTTTSSPNLVLEVNNANVTWMNPIKTQKEPEEAKKPKRRRKGKKSTKDEVKLKSEEENPIFTGPILKNITFTLERGHLIGVCGQVGVGKSTLLNMILGRVHMASGAIAVSARIAYVSQQPWITNNTVRENIVFGHDFDEERYKQVIQVCALEADFESMPLGDLTEVGERGVTLSGGQKQRVSLARAAYSTFDLVLLDDPLSAVDVHVGKHIFEQCISDWLKGRTRVFVTHQLQHLKHCDQILVMQDGSIMEKGSHQELLSSEGAYVSLLNVYEQERGGISEDKSRWERRDNTVMEGGKESGVVYGTGSTRPHNDESGVNGKGDIHYNVGKDKANNGSDKDKGSVSLIQKEIMKNTLNWSVLHWYIKAMGGYIVMAIMLFFYALPVTCLTTASWFLSYWINQGGGDANLTILNQTVPSDRILDNPDKDCYMTIYSCFLPVILVAMILRSFVTAKVGLSASTFIHKKGFVQLLAQPLVFFLSTPVGRIINRFSTDLDEIDNRLPMHMEIFLMNVLQVIAALAIIAYVSPLFLITAIPIGAIFWILVIVFHSCFHKLKSLDNVTRSPIISHLGASIQGLYSIHAYGKTKEFFKRYCKLLDTNSVPVFLYYSANRWLALRLDIISSLVIFFIGLLIVANFDDLNPALAGLGISYAIQMSGLFQFTVRLAIETEARFSSVQRLQEYCKIGKEDRKDTENNTTLKSISTMPPSDWPKDGQIKFSKVKLCYRHGLTPALKNVSFEVNAGEKVGIVGRTGSGKSSLCSVLFQMFDIDQGQISIDGLDISKVDPEILRSRLSIVPQDPVLLAGTIRYNLDPFKQHTDDALWEALRQCHAGELVNSLETQLDTKVKENGSNFSIGEKQLLCMARVFIKQSQILVLDEATASVDTETKALIQTALKEAFGGCTMLVIAHGLDSVLSYDKILVMDKGEVIEFDTPLNLLSNSSSKFAGMLNVTNSKDERA